MDTLKPVGRDKCPGISETDGEKRMDYKITVVIPIYNAEKWLRECLDSVSSQSLREIEIICVNDGSPDHSLAILKEYAATDSRIVIIDKQNEGVGAARNDGIRSARGEFIAFMDPDDKYPDKDSLSILYQAATENHVAVAGGYLGCMNENGKQIPKDRSYFGIDFTCEGLVQYKDYQCDFQFSAYIYNRAFLIGENLFFPTYSRFQDPPFFVNVMISAGFFYAVNRMTYIYRIGTERPRLNSKKVFDLLCGMSDNLKRSKKEGLARLHYLSAMRLLTDASYLVEGLTDDEAFDELVWNYIKAVGLIDEDLIAGAGYALPRPALPGVFARMIDESRQFRTFMKHKSARALRRLLK